MPSQKLIKRSMTIAGRRTSVALEEEYWAAFDRLARVRQVRAPQLIQHIEREAAATLKPGERVNLASAVRTYLLKTAKEA